jgi:hypothetical protein
MNFKINIDYRRVTEWSLSETILAGLTPTPDDGTRRSKVSCM